MFAKSPTAVQLLSLMRQYERSPGIESARMLNTLRVAWHHVPVLDKIAAERQIAQEYEP